MTDMNRLAGASLKRRLRRETRFRWYGRLALGFALFLLVFLLGNLLPPGIKGLFREEAKVVVAQAENAVDAATAGRMAKEGWRTRFAEADEKETRRLLRLLAPGYEREAYDQLTDHRGDTEIWLPLSDTASRYLHEEAGAKATLGEAEARLLETLEAEGGLRRSFHSGFLTGGDSRSPEKAGMGASIAGSLLVLAITMAIAFPIGVMAAVYLEEFARKGRLRDVIEVNINNLAAVPSIVYGLLGLAVFLNVFGLPRSAALAGGLTLALLILPVIIIATRASLAAVPSSIKDGALALGASPLQVAWHHTVPLALPGILTGTILGVARALGETAPLIMIGMVAFVADVPTSPADPASAMPVQIYLWASSPEAGFAEKTASGILVLIVILLSLNLLAIILRRRYERRW